MGAYKGSSSQQLELKALEDRLDALPDENQLEADIAAQAILLQGIQTTIAGHTGQLSTISQAVIQVTANAAAASNAAGAAQSTANTAVGAAGTAQTTANTANAAVGTLASEVHDATNGLAKRALQTALDAALATLATVSTAANKGVTDAAAAQATATAAGNLAAALNTAIGLNTSFRNKLINGKFDFWQRGNFWNVSGTSNQFTADRWAIQTNGGSTASGGQTLFTPGQTTVPGNPKSCITVNTNSAASTTAGAYVVLSQKIEGVRTFAGQTATLSFWVRGNITNLKVGVELVQVGGSGGGSTVTGIGSRTFTIAAGGVWQKCVATITLPSVASPFVIGPNGDDNLQVIFWLDCGSNNTGRSGGTPPQSGSFLFANVQLEEGSVATPFEDRLIALEEMLCWRYYENSFKRGVVPANGIGSTTNMVGIAYSTTAMRVSMMFKVAKRTTASITIWNSAEGSNPKANIWNTFIPSSGQWVSFVSMVIVGGDHLGFVSDSAGSGLINGNAYLMVGYWEANAEL